MSLFTTSRQLFFGRPRGTMPSTSMVVICFIHSLLRETCPCHLNLLPRTRDSIDGRLSFCSRELTRTRSKRRTPHIQRIIDLSVLCIQSMFFLVVAQHSAACRRALRTHALKSCPLRRNEIDLEVSSGSNSLNFPHAHLIRVVIALWQPPPAHIESPK